MILKTLTLKNFRKFKHISIEFADGVTGVIGLNGVGKSTLFEAFAWVLYGPVAARTSADQIKYEGAAPSDPCRVELEFLFEGDTYRIVREMLGKNCTPSATMLVNGKMCATGADPVTTYIEKKLAMDFRSFFTSVFAKQKELNLLSAINTSERRVLILRMLGIDALDKVIKEIGSDKRQKEAVVEKLRVDLVDDQGKNKCEIYASELKKLQTEKEGYHRHITTMKQKLVGLKKIVNEKDNDCRKNRQEYEKIRQKMEKLTELKTMFEKKQTLQEDVIVLEKKLQDRKKIIVEQQKKLESFGDINLEKKELEKRLSDIEKKYDALLKNIEQRKAVIEQRKKECTEIEQKKKKIEEMGFEAECPTCERVLGTQHDVLVQKFNRELQKKHDTLVQDAQGLKTKQEEFNIVHREGVALQKKKEYLHKQLQEKERIQTIITTVSEEIKREEKERNRCHKQLQEFGPLVFNKNDYQKNKDNVEVCYKNYQNSLHQCNEKKELLNQAVLEYERKESEKNIVVQKIADMKQRSVDLEKRQKQIKSEQQLVQNLAMLSEIMSSFRTHLISRIRPTLSSYASDFFNRLTDGKYQEIAVDENYNILIYDEGNSYAINRFSGGEEDLANLCLRLAISEVITERSGGAFNFIILDEIFGSQDMIRRQNIMKTLQGLSSKFRQIFLITHIDDVKNYVEHTITVTEDTTGVSSVSTR